MDIAGMLANYDALVGVALGAGLTYGFGALNRRHQEKRESETRWYQTRFQAYSDFSDIIFRNLAFRTGREELQQGSEKPAFAIQRTAAVIRLVGSAEVIKAMGPVLEANKLMAREKTNFDSKKLIVPLGAFERAARKDLGHPSP